MVVDNEDAMRGGRIDRCRGHPWPNALKSAVSTEPAAGTGFDEQGSDLGWRGKCRGVQKICRGRHPTATRSSENRQRSGAPMEIFETWGLRVCVPPVGEPSGASVTSTGASRRCRLSIR